MPRIDPDSGCSVFILDSDAEINEGLSYFYSDYVSVAGGKTLICTIQVNTKSLHFLYGITSSQFGFSFIASEGVTANEDGTEITPRNSNRNHPDASSVSIRLNPTGFNKIGATQLRRGYDGTVTNPAKGTGGSIAFGKKVILKANTKYALEITNLAPNATNDIMLNIVWDEL